MFDQVFDCNLLKETDMGILDAQCWIFDTWLIRYLVPTTDTSNPTDALSIGVDSEMSYCLVSICDVLFQILKSDLIYKT